MRFFQAGDLAVFVRTGEDISTRLSQYNRSLINRLHSTEVEGIIEYVPSYTGIMVYYDPFVTGYEKIEKLFLSISGEIFGDEDEEARGVVVPIAYGGEYGQDLNYVADLNGLTPGEVASIHCDAHYTVHMLGFTPGFAYLGGMDKRISAPRKAEPSLRIEAGSVGIAVDQTGIYPIESPGGWQIIGRTPLVLFDPSRKPEFLFHAGMKVRFRAVDNYEFWFICEEITAGDYKIETFSTKRL
jgi:inhibitor of KinA